MDAADSICAPHRTHDRFGPKAVIGPGPPHGVPYPVALMFVYHHFLFMPAAVTGGTCIWNDSIPLLMRAIPTGVGSLYLAAGLRLIQGRASAFPLFIGAIVALPLPSFTAHFIPGSGSTTWDLAYSPGLRDMVIGWAWRWGWTTDHLWLLIACLCIGLVVSLNNKRKITR